MKLGRTETVFSFKGLAEREHIREAAFDSDLGDQRCTLTKQTAGIFQPLAEHILVRRDTVDLFKATVKMEHRHIALPGNA